MVGQNSSVWGGRLLERALREEGIEAHDVRAAIRSPGLFRIQDVELAVLETNGSISVIPRDDKPTPNEPPEGPLAT